MDSLKRVVDAVVSTRREDAEEASLEAFVLDKAVAGKGAGTASKHAQVLGRGGLVWPGLEYHPSYLCCQATWALTAPLVTCCCACQAAEPRTMRRTGPPGR